MKYLKDLSVSGRRVLVRADLNVPLENGAVADDNRIREFLPTLLWILQQGGKPVVMSHLGEPEKRDPSLSLKPVVTKLAELSKLDVRLAPDCVGAEVVRLCGSAEPGQVIVLENLRFHAGEKDNDPRFAEQLSKLGEVYVNDAFGTAHRKHASIVGVPRFFKEKGAGLLMQKEIEFYERALVSPKRPLCVILGGLKVSSKLAALINLAQKADKLIIGGAMANTFLAAQGFQMGRSRYEPELFTKVVELIASLARRDCKLYLPVDFMVGPSPTATGLARHVTAQEIPADTMALDVGPATSLLFKAAIQTAETIIWNGPMGAFENEEYAKGTTDLIENLSSAHGLKVVGGGDTDAAIHKMELAHKFDFISTGGGAFLVMLEGHGLPGFQALE